MDTKLEALMERKATESKKFAFAKFSIIVLGILGLIALIGVGAAVVLDRNTAVVWLGVVASTCALSMGLLSLGYVLGQSALDMILTKAVGALEVTRTNR